MSSQDRYTEVKAALLAHAPFFASLLFDIMDVKIGKFPHIFGDMTPTAATDGKRIYIDEDFLAKLKLPEALFLVCHEIGHAIWLHMPRAKQYGDTGFEGKPFNHTAWNMAGDYVINDMLVKCGVGQMPAGGLRDHQYTSDMLVEDVYRDIMAAPPPDQGAGTKATGDGSNGDVHIPASGTTPSPAEMKRAVQSAANAAKAMGKMPAELGRFVDAFVNPKVTWQERLRTTLSKAIARDGTTWTRPHRRRLLQQGVFMPAYTGFGAGKVGVFIDTSGSIGAHELQQFLSEVDEILATCKPEMVILLGCDAEVGNVHILTDGDQLAGKKIDLGGGGGTSFIPPFEWIAKEGIPLTAAVYFTDMYGPFPDQPPPYPVIWCKTTDQKAPWGTEIEIDLKKE